MPGRPGPAAWNPTLYRRFEDERTRPAAELLARVRLDPARTVFDLGCGPGNATELLAQRWPQAQLVGVDNSATMLASARQRLPACRFVAADVADLSAWLGDTPPDLLYSNATLQWLGDHEALFPRLFRALAPGGVLAVQMPDNLDQPSHRLMREMAALPRFAAQLPQADQARTRLLPIGQYYDLLAAQADEVEVWHTVYQHRMDGPAAIVDWLRATGLKPYTDPLPTDERAAFLAAYEAAIAQAYPPRADGRRLLAFPRLFLVARKAV